MKLRLAILLVMLGAMLPGGSVSAAGDPPRTRHKGYYDIRSEIINGDTVQVYYMPTLPVFARKADMRKYERLVRNVKKVYPIAQEAQRRLAEMEEEVLKIPKKGKQREYIKQMERDLMKEYTPVLKQMTFSQGKIGILAGYSQAVRRKPQGRLR